MTLSALIHSQLSVLGWNLVVFSLDFHNLIIIIFDVQSVLTLNVAASLDREVGLPCLAM